MDVTASLKGIFLLCQIFGILPFGMKKSNGGYAFVKSEKRFTYTKLTFAVYFFAQVYLLWYGAVVNGKFISEKSLKTVLMMGCFSVAISYLIIFRSLFCYDKVFCLWLNRLDEMFSNVPEKSLNKIKFISALSLTITGIFLTVSASTEIYLRDIYDEYNKKAKNIFHKIYLMVFCFYASMWEMKIFLQLFFVLVGLLRSYYEEVHRTLKNGLNNENKMFWFGHLRELRLRDLEIKDLLDFLHTFFVPFLSCRLLWGFSNLLFHVTVAARVGIPQSVIVLWMFYVVFEIVMIATMCHFAEKISEKTPHYLHELFINWDDKELRNEIELYSLQVQHKKIEFSALGFHKLNFTLLYNMLATLTSTAIVLLQFENEPFITKDDCNRLVQNISVDSVPKNPFPILHSFPAPPTNSNQFYNQV